MNHARSVAAVAALWLWLATGAVACAPARQAAARVPQTEKVVTARATGTFEVKLTPQPSGDAGEGASLGRMLIDKQFRGDLEGTSKGEMLSALTNVKGSAGYVAIERVTGAVAGRSGTFVLQHSGTMTRGAPQLVITVVPDSGTGALTGITGTMTIDIAGGNHSYTFEYALAAAP